MDIEDQIPLPIDHDPDKLRAAAETYRETGIRYQRESMRYTRLADIYEELADLVSGEVSAASLRRRLFHSRVRFEERERVVDERPLLSGSFRSMPKPSPGAAAAEEPAFPFMSNDWLSELTYADAAYAVLEAMGHPMTTNEILDAMTKGGRPVGGKQPISTLGTTLRRDDRFFRTEEGTIDIRREEGVDEEE